jgi:hypothetical protein
MLLLASHRFGATFAGLLTTLIRGQTDTAAPQVCGVGAAIGTINVVATRAEMLARLQRLPDGACAAYIVRTNQAVVLAAHGLFKLGVGYGMRDSPTLKAKAKAMSREKKYEGLFSGEFDASLVAAMARQHDTGAVQLHTVHTSKGLEWDTVLVDDEVFEVCRSEDDGEKLLYVALSRAKSNLVYTLAAQGLFENAVCALNPPAAPAATSGKKARVETPMLCA